MTWNLLVTLTVPLAASFACAWWRGFIRMRTFQVLTGLLLLASGAVRINEGDFSLLNTGLPLAGGGLLLLLFWRSRPRPQRHPLEDGHEAIP